MTWNNVAKLAKRYKQKKRWIQDIPVAKDDIPHPASCGFRRDKGLPRGQVADWRLRIGRGCLHVLEYDMLYLAHWDDMDPGADMKGHIFSDVIPFFFRVLAIVLLLLLAVTIG